jgi:hypothetical protein
MFTLRANQHARKRRGVSGTDMPAVRTDDSGEHKRDYRRSGRGRKRSLGISTVAAFAIASASASRAYSSVSPNVHSCRSETVNRRSTVDAFASISTMTSISVGSAPVLEARGSGRGASNAD